MLRKLLAAGVLALTVGACAPGVESAPPPYRTAQPVQVAENGLQTVPGVDVHMPSMAWLAVDEFFPEPGLNACAHRIAERESHHHGTADNGSHHGLFQLGGHFAGTLSVAATNLGQWPWWWSARQNAMAARMIYNASGWAPWGGC